MLVKRVGTMSTTSTDDSSKRLAGIFSPFIFCVFLLGCDRSPETSISHPSSSSSRGEACDLESIEIIGAALAEFRSQKNFSSISTQSDGRIVVIWGGVRPPLSYCPNDGGLYSVNAPGQLPAGSLKPDVAVTSFFRNQNAAYVRATIYPMEANGEFFLSREAGKWVVVDKVVWKQ